MSSARTWREVARELGNRLAHQAILCGASRGLVGVSAEIAGGCDHDPARSFETAAECPFCADHAAWASWCRKESQAAAAAARRACRAREVIVPS